MTVTLSLPWTVYIVAGILVTLFWWKGTHEYSHGSTGDMFAFVFWLFGTLAYWIVSFLLLCTLAYLFGWQLW